MDLGRLAYHAYGDHASWTTFDGRPMPLWDDLTDAVREHWDAAAEAVRTELES